MESKVIEFNPSEGHDEDIPNKTSVNFESSSAVLLGWDQLSEDVKKCFDIEKLGADPENCLFVLDTENEKFFALTNISITSIDTTGDEGIHRRIEKSGEINHEFAVNVYDYPPGISQYADMYRNWLEKLEGPEDDIEKGAPNASLDEMVEALIIKHDLDANETTKELLKNVAKSTIGYTAPFNVTMKAFHDSCDKIEEE